MKQIKNRAGLPAGRQGFTLIEILVVIGIIAVLAAVVLVAINPARQFAQARNSQRNQNVSAILDAIGQNIADSRGDFNLDSDGDGDTDCTAIPAVAAKIGNGVGQINLRPCLVPTYMSELPQDPEADPNTCVDTIPGDCAGAPIGTYDTDYEIYQDSTSGRITITAPQAELTETISVTR